MLRLSIAGWRWIPALAAAMLAYPAGATLINFDPPGSPTVTTSPLPVTTLYGPLGVVFPVAFLDKDANAHSGTQVLRSNTFAAEFPSDPLIMNFTSAQQTVSFWASSHLVTANGTLTGFDAANNVVATDGPHAVAADVFTTHFQIQVSSPTIVRAEYQLDQMVVKSIDDLDFEGQPPATVPTTPPVVTIQFPVNGSQTDVEFDAIAGTVTGAGVISPVAVNIQSLQQSGVTNQPITIPLTPVVGAPTPTQQFLQIFGVYPLGPITVTVTAENIGNLKGSASSSFFNLPTAIRNRFTAEGGAAVFGAFKFGLILTGCKTAVWENGAISTDGPVNTHVIRGDIFTKWLTVTSLGCATSDEGDGPAGTRIQDFDGGRIYAHLPLVEAAPLSFNGGTLVRPSAAAYVPKVFLDALRTRGGEDAITLPVADPSHSTGLALSHLFQQFTRPPRTDLLPSTLEIQGFPPTLYLERQGGDLTAPAEFSATRWEQFPCETPQGPCSVDPTKPSPPGTISDSGQFCGENTYSPIPQPFGSPPEWQAIAGDYVTNSMFGVITSAFYADIDNALTHEHTFGNCPDCPDTVFGATLPFGGLCPTCPSDYEFKVWAIGPQPPAISSKGQVFPSLIAASNDTNRIKVEYELYYASAAHNFLDAPQTGDLAYVAGRWIIDCGHDSFKSELHPLFAFAKMRTVTSILDPFTGLPNVLFGGRPGTRIDIWVNGWYPGGDSYPFEFDIFPPPRTSPDANLLVIKPLDFGPNAFATGEDVTLEYALLPATDPNHVHLRFTSPPRQNTVTDAGEMMFQDGREYWGMWFAYWDQ